MLGIMSILRHFFGLCPVCSHIGNHNSCSGIHFCITPKTWHLVGFLPWRSLAQPSVFTAYWRGGGGGGCDWTMRFLYDSSFGWHVPWLIFPLNETSHGRMLPDRCVQTPNMKGRCLVAFYYLQLRFVSGCCMLFYCSRECQKADWKAHKVHVCTVVSWMQLWTF